MSWTYNGIKFDTGDIDDYVGFVYRITNLTNGMEYIGKKHFFRKITKPPLKGQKRKRRSKVESDWKEYFGSNKKLKEDVETLGPENFKREILRLCKTKGEMSYYETKAIFVEDAILNENYYNEWVTVKVSKNHVNVPFS